MGWLFVGLILGSIFYSTKIIGEYTRFSLETEPHILRLEQGAAELDQVAETETTLRDEIRNRVEDLQIWVADLHLKVATLKGEMFAEEARLKRLQMEANKQRIKSGRSA